MIRKPHYTEMQLVALCVWNTLKFEGADWLHYSLDDSEGDQLSAEILALVATGFLEKLPGTAIAIAEPYSGHSDPEAMLSDIRKCFDRKEVQTA